MTECNRCGIQDLEWRESKAGCWVLWNGEKPHFLSCRANEQEVASSGDVTNGWNDSPEALPSTRTPRQQENDALAEEMTDDRVEAVHEGLRVLAGMCDGAVTLDGTGFNKIDTNIGHQLAERERISERQAAMGVGILLKYEKQLPAELYAAIKGGCDGKRSEESTT